MKNPLSSALAFALTATLAAGAAQAALPSEVEISVSHSDLDLTSASDVAVMEARIEAAVTAACANVGRDAIQAACVTDGTEKAMSALMERARIASAYTASTSR